MPQRRPFLSMILLALALWTAPGSVRAADRPFQPETGLRRPMALVADEAHLYVANRDSGTISVIDRGTRRVTAEVAVGGQLSDLVALPAGRLLAVDRGRHQLIVLDRDAGAPRVVQRLDVPHTPVDIEVSPSGKLCGVTSLWARQLTLIDVADRLTARPPLDLPFAPRTQRFVTEGQLVVAEAFGGQLAVIDTAAGRLHNRLTIDGHNIRSLVPAHGGKRLNVTHQLLDRHVTTTHEHVFWGGVMKNFMRSVPLDYLLDEEHDGDLLAGSTYPLGYPSGATGDPGAMLVTRGGSAALLLSGVNEIALRRRPLGPFVRRDIGRRPSALCASPDESLLYVANRLDDSISIVDLAALKVTETISLGPQPPLTPAQRGEVQFYSADLSLDGWYSCHSCHTGGHSNGLLNDNFGDDYFGDPKRVPSLLGSGRTHPWAWNGKTRTLEDQIVKSITVTMQGERPDEQTVGDLAAYLKTLQPPPGLSVARGRVDRAEVAAGRRVFEQRGCVDCHAAPTFTSAAVYDVGLTDNSGNSRFNPPSLLGVSQRGPYFHDGRAGSLREVIGKFQHNLQQPLPAGERDALLAFLESL